MSQITKVWVLHSGCIYEGGGLDGLFFTYESARAAALKMVESENEWRKRANRDPEKFKFKLYKEIDTNNWSNEIDYIKIFEKEIKP